MPTVVLTTIVSPTSRVPVCAARAFFKCKKYSLSSSCCLIFCKLSELSCEDLLWMWVTPQYLLGSRLTALKHADGVRCNVTPIMNNVCTRMQEPQICSSALRSQPVFHLLLEAPKRGWKLDHLDIPVAWMFSLQRTSIHCFSLTKHTNIFSSSPLLSTRSDAVSATSWPSLMWNWEIRFC